MRVPGMHLQMLRRDEIRIGDHRCLILTDRDFPIIPPCRRGDRCRRQPLQLSLHFHHHRFGQGPVRRDQPHPRPHVMLGLRQQVRRDHLHIPGSVGQDIDLRRPRQLVDPHRPEDLPLRLVHKGIARPHDLHHRRHRFRTVGHCSDRLRAADPEHAVRAGKVAPRDHRLVRVRRQAGDDLLHPCHLGRDNRHDRSREEREAPARHIAADPRNRDHPVSHVDARQALHLQGQDRRQLRFGEPADVGDGKLGVCPRLRVQRRHRRFPLGHRNLQRAHLGLVEPG